jgi:hypothetical protein
MWGYLRSDRYQAGLIMATAPAVAVQSVPAPPAGKAGVAKNAIRQLGAAIPSGQREFHQPAQLTSRKPKQPAGNKIARRARSQNSAPSGPSIAQKWIFCMPSPSHRPSGRLANIRRSGRNQYPPGLSHWSYAVPAPRLIDDHEALHAYSLPGIIM